MSQETSMPEASAEAGLESLQWVRLLPEGAVSVETQGPHLILRASRMLQECFEQLLENRKAGTLTPEENEQYQAICDLDDALSWLNRLARAPLSD